MELVAKRDDDYELDELQSNQNLIGILTLTHLNDALGVSSSF